MSEQLKKLHQQQLEDLQALQQMMVAGVVAPNLNSRKDILENIINREKEIDDLQQTQIYQSTFKASSESFLRNIEQFTASPHTQIYLKKIKQNIKNIFNS